VSDFEKELRSLINKHSKENGSNTPDFMLANFLVRCLEAYTATVRAREEWYGRAPTLAPPEVAAQLDKVGHDE